MTTDQLGGFIRCPRCKTMWGPTRECPSCGWSIGCAWCGRAWIPGKGWRYLEGPRVTQTHGMCPQCYAQLLGGELAIQVLFRAAERLGIPDHGIRIRKRRTTTGTVLWFGRGNRTGATLFTERSTG